MKTVAIIAEYNPFHNGHKYIVEQAKHITNANYCISIMSGNFLQRGYPGMWDKYTRATIAALEGVDLCLELPFPYATGSAYDFAIGAVSILNSLNSVDYLCFGVETDNIEAFKTIADILTNEPTEYQNQLKTYLSNGLSFPIARANALANILNDNSIIDLLATPNNILAIEYIHALKVLNSPIKPITIKRLISEYHDTDIKSNISSATAIRNQFLTNTSNDENITENIFNLISTSIPDNSKALLQRFHKIKGPVYPFDINPFIQSKLITAFDYTNICDFTNELNNKLNKINPSKSYSDILDTLKTKDITSSRISRALLHMVIGYTSTMRKAFANDRYAYYANILSFKKASSTLLREITTKSQIPIITKKADFERQLGNYPGINKDNAHIMWSLDTSATTLYNCLLFNRYNISNCNDYTQQLPIV